MTHELIKRLSKKDKYGKELLKYMDWAGINSLSEATEESLVEYFKILEVMNEKI